MAQSICTSFTYTIKSIESSKTGPLFSDSVNHISSILKSMHSASAMDLDPQGAQTTFQIEFDQIEVAYIVLLVRSVSRIRLSLKLLSDDKEVIFQSDIEETQDQGNKKQHVEQGYVKHNLRIGDREVYNACELVLVSAEESSPDQSPKCATFMIRGAKSQLERGRELRDRTKLNKTGAVTTSAKKDV